MDNVVGGVQLRQRMRSGVELKRSERIKSIAPGDL